MSNVNEGGNKDLQLFIELKNQYVWNLYDHPLLLLF